MTQSVLHCKILRQRKGIFKLSLFMFAFFIMKLGQFLLVPFLVIYLSHFSLSPLSIGLIIAWGQGVYSLTSLFTGYLSDKYPPQRVFLITLLGTSITYELLYQNQTLIFFIILNGLISVLRAIFDGASKTFVATSVEEQHRNLVFGLRYALLNLAAALGPMLGIHYAKTHANLVFHHSAFCNLATCFLLFIGLLIKENKTKKPNKIATKIIPVHLLASNSSLKRLCFINFICYTLYAQITSSLAQYVTTQLDDGLTLYSNLLIVNAVTCVVAQIFIAPLIKKINYMFLASLGLFLFALGFGGFGLAQNSLTFTGSMFLLSLGEVIFFPLNDVLLAKIAPPKTLGLCYGILNASTLGLAVGPILGGAVYQLGNYYALFFICAVTALLTTFLYRKLVLIEEENR